MHINNIADLELPDTVKKSHLRLKINLTANQRLCIATLLALCTCLLYLSYNVTASWEFTLQFRGKKLLTFLLVAIAISTATLLFQTLSNNRIITPAIIGFDSLYILIQTALLFLLGAMQYTLLNVYLKWALEISLLVLAASCLFQWLFVKKRHSLYLLILIGVVFGVLFHSLASLLMRMMNPAEFTLLEDSMFASFNAADPHLLLISTMLIGCIGVFVCKYHHQYDVLALGEAIAINLGINHRRLSRLTLIIIISLIGLSTSLVGPVTFFGLLVVNLAYIVSASHLHRHLIPMAICCAIITLVGSDVLLQHFLHYSVKLSIIIEFVGGIFFLVLILRNKIR
ncbi:MAG: hypothetical protein OFPI_16750 [Osedax symbiont Rs2]|nr:MAG: hypothetical protein OFPI_16750 [Osedax symbiont Rs2]